MALRSVALRLTRRWGPHRIAYHLHLARSTVGRVQARYRMPRLADIDRATGLPVRKPPPRRYEAAAPGLLVHVDIKKQGRIPGGGGWRAHSRGSAQDKSAGAARGKAARPGAAGSRCCRYLHHAVDDHSRVAYSEILDDEPGRTAAASWARANTFFAGIGVAVTAVMTDNGSCHRSRGLAAASGETVKHKRTKPYHPQTNGKVERFNRALAAEWAYARDYASEAAYHPWPTTRITADPTPQSAAPPQTAFTTSRGSTTTRSSHACSPAPSEESPDVDYAHLGRVHGARSERAQ